jgi:hypothetical protein
LLALAILRVGFASSVASHSRIVLSFKTSSGDGLDMTFCDGFSIMIYDKFNSGKLVDF